jgi:hypothetical protein
MVQKHGYDDGKKDDSTLTVDCWLLTVDCWLLTVDCWLLMWVGKLITVTYWVAS